MPSQIMRPYVRFGGGRRTQNHALPDAIIRIAAMRSSSRRTQRLNIAWRSISTPVCTENLIRVDDAMESPKLADDRVLLFRPGPAGLAIQVEDAA
jgi:hypothetical protein